MAEEPSYTSQSPDTPADIDRKMIELYRRMAPWEKMRLIGELNEATDQLAKADIAARYPGATRREIQLRLAARKYGRELVVEAFGWDPDKHGY